MTEYKPWFKMISPMTEKPNIELDYKSEYERVMKENKELCLMIGDLVSEKCKLTIELNKLKSHPLPVETVYNGGERVFSNDCATAVKELLEIIKNNKHFRYTSHSKRGIQNAYYSIINNMDITIFYLEDHSENNFHGLAGLALITAPLFSLK